MVTRPERTVERRRSAECRRRSSHHANPNRDGCLESVRPSSHRGTVSNFLVRERRGSEMRPWRSWTHPDGHRGVLHAQSSWPRRRVAPPRLSQSQRRRCGTDRLAASGPAQGRNVVPGLRLSGQLPYDGVGHSACGAETHHDQLVQAHVLLGSRDREVAVQGLGQTHEEPARVGTVGEGFGDGVAVCA